MLPAQAPHLSEGPSYTLRRPISKKITKRTKKSTKRIFAIPTAAEAIPAKPNIAAIIAKTRNPIPQPSIVNPSFRFTVYNSFIIVEPRMLCSARLDVTQTKLFPG